MNWMLDATIPAAGRAVMDVLDVGAYDVNGSYRKLVEGLGFQSYTGCDIKSGPNVDLIIPDSDVWSPDRTWPVIISGQVLEHTRNPFSWMKQVEKAIGPEGWLFLIAPYNHPFHYHPIDCWRILPDGMKELIHSVGIHVVTLGWSKYKTGNGDTYASASRVARPSLSALPRASFKLRLA